MFQSIKKLADRMADTPVREWLTAVCVVLVTATYTIALLVVGAGCGRDRVHRVECPKDVFVSAPVQGPPVDLGRLAWRDVETAPAPRAVEGEAVWVATDHESFGAPPVSLSGYLGRTPGGKDYAASYFEHQPKDRQISVSFFKSLRRDAPLKATWGVRDLSEDSFVALRPQKDADGNVTACEAYAVRLIAGDLYANNGVLVMRSVFPATDPLAPHVGAAEEKLNDLADYLVRNAPIPWGGRRHDGPRRGTN